MQITYIHKASYNLRDCAYDTSFTSFLHASLSLFEHHRHVFASIRHPLRTPFASTTSLKMFSPSFVKSKFVNLNIRVHLSEMHTVTICRYALFFKLSVLRCQLIKVNILFSLRSRYRLFNHKKFVKLV